MRMAVRRILAIVAVNLGAAAVIWWQSAGWAGGSTRMDLEITVRLGLQDVIVGESTSISIDVTNVSSRRLSLPDPTLHGLYPKIRVHDVAAKKDVLTLGARELERKQVQEFVAPEPLPIVEMAPRQQAHRSADLLKWIGPLPPGHYEVTALIDYEAIHAASVPVQLTVEPLDLGAASTVGSHSGDSPYRFCFWAAKTRGGSALILTYFVFDAGGRYQVAQSTRLVDLNSPVTPAASTTQNQLSYPAQWVAWLTGEGLTALYVKQGKIELPARTNPLQGAASAKLISPLLLDLTGSDGSRPGRGIVPIWRPGASGSQLDFHTLEPDGSLSAGPSVPLQPGELRWGRSVALSNGERRFYLAIERDGETELESVKWGDKAASRVDHFRGSVIGGALSIDAHDNVSGAAAVRAGTMLSIRTWRSEGSGGAHPGPTIDFAIAGNPVVETAVVVANAGGKPSVLSEAADHRWFWLDAAGASNLMPQQLAQFGRPIDAFWLKGVSLQVLMAGAQTGVTYQPVR